jgi:hypothetical protein
MNGGVAIVAEGHINESEVRGHVRLRRDPPHREPQRAR